MILLTFAHRGEAQVFLKENNWKSHPNFNDLYVSEELALLITKEGSFQSSIALSRALGLYPHITKVINLGIAGSLTKDLQKFDIIQIKNCYAEDEYKSFSLICEIPHIPSFDCITSKKRILNNDDGKLMAVVAPIVDRELWGLSFVCKESNIPLQSIKLISDHIGDVEFCKIVKEESLDFSDRLYQFFITNLREEKIEPNDSNTVLEIENDPNFYLTVSQKRELKNLYHLLISKTNLSQGEINKKINIEHISKLEQLPKNRSKILALELKKLLYPIRFEIAKHLDEICFESKKLGLNFKFSEDLESKIFHLNTQISSAFDLEQTIKALKKFDYKRYENLLNGNIDLNL